LEHLDKSAQLWRDFRERHQRLQAVTGGEVRRPAKPDCSLGLD